MKKFLFCFLSLAVSAPLFAALPNQPAIEPPATGNPLTQREHGLFATRDAAIAYSANPLTDADTQSAKTFDNFTIGAGPGYQLSGVSWVGVYDEKFPTPASGGPSDTDFIFELWNDNAGAPNFAAGPFYTVFYEGGAAAGMGGPDLSVVGNGDLSVQTQDGGGVITPGGGPGFNYSASLPQIAATKLAPGNYWVSIQANQSFDNLSENDPLWQWHFGQSNDNNIYHVDREAVPVFNGLVAGIDNNKGMAYALRGSLVPEPSTMAMSLIGMLSLGLIRRKRS